MVCAETGEVMRMTAASITSPADNRLLGQAGTGGAPRGAVS